MRGEVKTGTCGFRWAKQTYCESLDTVEIQQTFYQPPQIKTLENWRKQLPDNFEFTLKAWQLITHHPESPTYRRLSRRTVAENDLSKSGGFRWTEVVKNAWETTKMCALALKARTVLFQCPAEFTPTKSNIKNLEKFFSNIDRSGINFAWEPRGDWTSDLIGKLCSGLDLWHAVDPFKTTCTTPTNQYFRLHGRIRWRYEYEDVELDELAAIMDGKLSYAFFNNVTMFEDAKRFREILRASL